ncbi:MAG: hypothetical protein IJ329_00915 [Clostridia bacterium]|nr:hypothetical protein [Clostridia bacterium]
MDAKITKQRLGRLLSYDWLKIIGIIAGFIVIWSLIFTMTSTQITPSQQFTVFNHYANVSLDYGKFYDGYNSSIENGVFSYEVIEADVIDLTTAGDQRYTMCDTRFTTGQGDMMFVPNITDTEKEEEGLAFTYPESFFARYSAYIVSWDEYLESARDYLNDYFDGDYQNGELNEAKAERDFRARVKANNDKRFRKESKLEDGIEDEKERLNKYRTEFLKFEQYLQDGIVKLENIVYKNTSTGEPYLTEQGEIALQGNYALNICPDESKMSGLKNQVYYSVEAADGTKKPSAQDMCVMLFLLPDMDQDFQYETILFLNTVIAVSITPTQA